MVFQNPEHGVGVITIKNKTHLYYEHITVADNKVIDSFWIDRESENIETTEQDIFVVIMWIIFALLMVITAVSVYYKCSKSKKSTLYDDITLTVD
jgi:hypothetical protein